MSEKLLAALKPFADASRRCLEFGDPEPEARVYAEQDACEYELLKGEEGALDQTSLTVADIHALRELYDELVTPPFVIQGEWVDTVRDVTRGPRTHPYDGLEVYSRMIGGKLYIFPNQEAAEAYKP